MTEAQIATFRRLLESEVRLLKKAPKWLWEFEFAMHVWTLLERESRERTDPQSFDLLEAVQATQSVTAAIEAIEYYLDGPVAQEAEKPW